MKNLFALSFFWLILLGVMYPLPAISQADSTDEIKEIELEEDNNSSQKTIDSFTLNKAKNYARQAIEKENGGLQKYRAEASMHGPPFSSPYEINSDGTITFMFYGSTPDSSTYTYESVVTVDPETFSVLIEYNGAVQGENINIEEEQKQN
jgi:hypothetical protein